VLHSVQALTAAPHPASKLKACILCPLPATAAPVAVPEPAPPNRAPATFSRSQFRIRSVHVFFLDWEKPRRVLAKGGGREEAAPVSCWRTLLVANEWNELQVCCFGGVWGGVGRGEGLG
jgi:hypothetical protein